MVSIGIFDAVSPVRALLAILKQDLVPGAKPVIKAEARSVVVPTEPTEAWFTRCAAILL